MGLRGRAFTEPRKIRLRRGRCRGTIRCVKPVLVTERLALRQFTAADVDGLLKLDGDPAVMRFISKKTRSRAEIEAEVLPQFLGYYARYRDFGHWAADTRDNGEFIGWFGLRPVVATISSTPSSVKARWTRARDPSVAYPLPQADRRSR